MTRPIPSGPLHLTPGRRVAVEVEPSGDYQLVVTATGDTVYYGNATVSQSSFTGSLSTGQSVTLSSTTYFAVSTALLNGQPASASLNVTATPILGDSGNLTPNQALRVVREAPLNVRWPEYGAAGDGVADDTAAFTLALTAAGQGDVQATDGTFILNQLPFTAPGQRIVGAGRGNTLLKAKAGAAYVVGATGLQRCGLANLAVDGNAKASNGLLLKGGGSASQQHSVEHVDFGNCAIGIDVATGVPDQVDKNTYYHCQVHDSAQGMRINSANGQQQQLINVTFDSITGDAIELTAGSLEWIGGQVQVASRTLWINGANVNWVGIQGVITEGTTNDIVSSGGASNWPSDGVHLRQCVLSATTYNIDPGSSSGALLVAELCRFNTGQIGRATSSDFCFFDVANAYANGAAWVPSTAYPRRVRFNRASDASSGLQVDSYNSRFTALANGAALVLNGAGQYIAIAASGSPNNCVFLDSADNILKFKDNGGTLHALY